MNDLQPIGINYGFQFHNGTHQQFVDWCAAARPKTTLVMNAGSKELHQLREAINHDEAVLIHRVTGGWGAEENELWGKVSEDRILTKLRWERDNGIPMWVWHGISNEPAPGNSAAAHKDMADWHAKVMDKACNEGFRLSIMNLGSGVVPPAVIDAGAYDHFIKRYWYWYQRGLARWAFHEYTAGDMPVAVGVRGKPFTDEYRQEHAVLDMSITPQDWLHRHEIEALPRSVIGKYRPLWHIGRVTWFIDRAVEIGVIDDPDDFGGIDITEANGDKMGDLEEAKRYMTINGKTDHLYRLAETIAPPMDNARMYSEYRGHNSWIKFYENKYPQWSGEQAYYEMTRWQFEDLYPKAVEGMTLFTWSYQGAYKPNPGPLEWGGVGFNIAFMPQFLKLVKDRAPVTYKTAVPEPEPPTVPDLPSYVLHEVITSHTTFVRESARRNSEAVGTVRAGTRMRVYKTVPVPDRAGRLDERTGRPYQWQRVAIQTGDTWRDGYLAVGYYESIPVTSDNLSQEIEALRQALADLTIRVAQLEQPSSETERVKADYAQFQRIATILGGVVDEVAVSS